MFLCYSVKHRVGRCYRIVTCIYLYNFNKGNKMSLFVEVFDLEKNCNVIINLDSLLEIAPKQKLVGNRVADDGCDLFFADGAAVGGKRTMKVRDSYSMFKQFAMQTVSADDVAKVNGRVSSGVTKEKAPITIPTL